MDFECEKGKKK